MKSDFAPKSKPLIDLTRGSRSRVIVLTALGTLCCMILAFAVDSYSWETGGWRWGEQPINNFIIPLLIAPPFFAYLLNKQRQLAVAHHELTVIAATDPLTSLLNRRAFTALVDGYLDRMEAREATGEGALLIIDVDHFKNINDTYGHECGDIALVRIADTIKASVRQTDIVGRIGGEEFSVLLPNVGQERAVLLAENIRLRICSTELICGGQSYTASVSIGGAVFGRDASFSDLYRHADRKLYEAKNTGRNRCLISAIGAPAAAPVH